MIAESEQTNYETLRDCVSNAIISKLSIEPKKTRRRARASKSKPVSTTEQEASAGFGGNDAEDLGDFIDYLATEIFTSFAPELRQLSYSAVQNDTKLSERYSLPLSPSFIEDRISVFPVSVTESLETYSLTETVTLTAFFTPILTSYVATATSAPPPWASTRASACELCAREHIPLTYHHLIPKAVHAKVMKRGWHEEWELNKVAWLCRACHSFVHRVASNEELAKSWYSLELLGEREDVQAFVGWVGKVRWKKR